MRQRQFDLIVFDWDGTLYDSTALIVLCIQAAARDLGVAVPSQQDAAYVIGLGLTEALQHAVPGLPASRYSELVERYRHHYFKDQHAVTLFDGVPGLLQALRDRQHQLAIATGKSRRGLNEAMQAADLNRWFDASRTADETRSKPHPQMLQELMAELGVEPARTLMIGDTTHDLQLATNAGAASVAVAYGAHAGDALLELAPLHLAHSVTDLQNWLLHHG
ncbi:MAG: HAD family hydrolase [Leptothrix sp. (in: b-proteobacteria)]